MFGIGSIVFSLPIVFACILLGAVAVLILKKEKGALFILIGAAFMLFIEVSSPFLLHFVLYRIFMRIGNPLLLAHLIINIFKSVAVLLIAVGLFMKKQDVEIQLPGVEGQAS